MKKKFLVLFLALVMCFSLTACKDKEENNTNNNNQQNNNSNFEEDMESLNDITDKIVEFFQSEKAANYSNITGYYIDAGNNKVVVELKDNSKEAQDWFKKNVVNSNKIEFTKSNE